MSGVLTAYHILSTSAPTALPSIILLDARRLCSGATGRNGGHAKVKTATLAGLADDAARNEMQTYVFGVMAALKEIVEREPGLGDECEFEERRSFDVFQDGDEVALVRRVYDAAVEKDERWTRRVAWIGKDTVEKETSIKGAVGGFSAPCVSLWPYKFVTGLLGRMVDRYPLALNVQMNTPVTSISNDNVLVTPRGSLSAGKIVFATNAWTAGLLPDFKGAITPVRGMASHIVPEDPARQAHLDETYNIHFAPDAHGSTGVDYLNPRPDGGIVVGGGSWFFRQDRDSWHNNFDDSSRFPASVEKHWENYMQDTFLGWEESQAKTESVWTGIMGSTKNGKPHIGRVPGRKEQWILAGFNGGGMALIGTAAKAVAAMVLGDKDFGEVKEEFGLLDGFETSMERLGKEAMK
jgi:glycine/D-amino acid oxidase-like deaminating enzyme